jgi:hypothetical protein
MKYFWVIETNNNEYSSSYKYITDTLEDAEAHRMEYCGWYCQPGDVYLIRIDQNFREVEHIKYWQGKVWEHKVNVYDDKGVYVDDKYLIKKGKKVK